MSESENIQPQAQPVPPENPLKGLAGMRFGHYSDDNKTLAQTNDWHLAEELFRRKNYPEAFAAFFRFLKDEQENNVQFVPVGLAFTFEIAQGSRVITGRCDGSCITAETPLAAMPEAGTAVMRRLLELNYKLYYSRCSLSEEGVLLMMMETTVAAANPQKLYHGLRELSTRADKQDDLLLTDFPQLQPVYTGHIATPMPPLPDIKYQWYCRWLQDALNLTAGLNQDAFAGPVTYILLSALYRIDFLISPQGALLQKLETISQQYWNRKEELTLIARNQLVREGMEALLAWPRSRFDACISGAAATFSEAAGPDAGKARDNISAASKVAHWCMDNNYPELAMPICEYGVGYNQYSYGMPQVINDLTIIFYAVLHPDFFRECGLADPLYEPAGAVFHQARIKSATDVAIQKLNDKYTSLSWDDAAIGYSSLYDFATTFSSQMANLNLEQKRAEP